MSVVGTLRWRATHAHLRACACVIAFGGAGITFGRPDLLVLALPFAIVAFWSTMTRPAQAAVARSALEHRTLHEGEATTWSVTVSGVPGIDAVVASLASGPWWRLAPRSGVACVAVPRRPTADQNATLAIAVRSTRWGRRDVGPCRVAATTSWAAFRGGPAEVASLPLTTLPLPATADDHPSPPSSGGLIGLNRSHRRGEGTEFATIRPFVVGDRIRRVHWPVSLRTGTLHVAATFTDCDLHVMLILDTGHDVGTSTGLGGAASSLDLTVRAAGAMAEHFVRRGDRVGLRTFGSPRSLRMEPGSGLHQLRRLLGALSHVEGAGSGPTLSGPGRMGLPPGGLVIVLSPLLAHTALEQVVRLARCGLNVIVVDTLPTDMASRGDVHDALAWRTRLLVRRCELDRLQEEGVPIEAWRGPHSINPMLRRLDGRVRSTRVAHR